MFRTVLRPEILKSQCFPSFLPPRPLPKFYPEAAGGLIAPPKIPAALGNILQIHPNSLLQKSCECDLGKLLGPKKNHCE